MKGINLLTWTLLMLSAQVSVAATYKPPVLNWTIHLPVCIKSTPALGDDGMLYASGSQGYCSANSSNGTIAIDPSSGNLLWGPTHPAPCSTSGEIAVGANRLVYSLTNRSVCDGQYIYALNADDGSLAWVQDSEDIESGNILHSILTVDEELGRVYSGSSSLIAYDMYSGGLIWKQERKLIADHEQPQSFIISPYGDIYYSILNSTTSSGLDAFDSTGTLLWQIPLGERRSFSILGVTSQSHLIVKTDGFDSFISAYDHNGVFLWRFNDSLSDFVEDGSGNYYFTSTESPDVTSLFSDGSLRWNIAIPEAIWTKISFIDEEDTLYATSDKGLYAVDGETGEILWMFHANNDLLPDVAAVLTSDGAIFLADSSSTIYRLDAKLSYARSSWPIAKYADHRHTRKARIIHSLSDSEEYVRESDTLLIEAANIRTISISDSDSGDDKASTNTPADDQVENISIDATLRANAIADPMINGNSIFPDNNAYIGLRSDFNGDMVDDPLIFNVNSGTVVIWKMDTMASVDSIPITAIEESNWKIVGTGDFNADNSDDILLYNEITFQVVAWIMVDNQIQKSKILTTLNNITSHYYEVRAIGDFDGDGDDDLCIFNPLSNTVRFYVIENASIVSTLYSNNHNFIAWTMLGSGDFNADGSDDILLHSEDTGEIAIWIMQNNHIVSSYGLATLTDPDWEIFGIGDYNSDGYDEIFLYHTTSRQVVAWQLNGTSISGSAGIADLSGTDWSPVTVGDYNGDSKDDILVWNESTHETVVWLLDGPSISQSVGLGAISNEWKIVSLLRRNRFQFNSDFNGDRKADILLTDTVGGEVSVLFSNLKTTNLITNLLGTGWRILYKGDFNADQSAEVVLINDNTGTVVLWSVDGYQVVSSVGIATIVDACWSIAAAADFDGNGTTDLLLEHASTRQRVIWSMNGAAIESAESVRYAGTDWILIETGDFNGDDKADLLLENATTHDVVIWFMSGANMIGGGGLATISDLNWEIKGTGDFDGDGRSDIVLRNHQTSEVVFWRVIDNMLVFSAGVDERFFSSLDDTWSIAQINDITGDGRDDIIWRRTGPDLRLFVWAMIGNRPTQYESGDFATLSNANLEIVK